MSGTYLYAIVPADAEGAVGIRGVDGVSPVRLVAGDGLGCVVSNYKAKGFAALLKEEIVRSLLAHQQVVEHVMRDRTVLPVKFGTLLGSSREARAALSQARTPLLNALASIRDKIEIEVAATWDIKRVLHEISQEEDVVLARRAIEGNRTPPLTARVHLGEIVKQCMDRRRQSLQARMTDFLKPFYADMAPNVLISDELVMNVAFLVERSCQRDFVERIQQLDQDLQGEIAFRLIGPLPPYSFSTVEVTPMNHERIREARELLDLADGLSEASIRRAYRRMAADEQRNLAAGEEIAKVRFVQLKRASELLLSYCRAERQAHTGANGRTVSRTQSDRLFLVTIRRSDAQEIEATRFGARGEAQRTR